METPICDFARRYASDGTVRMHMPGHKGISALGIESLDITEIEGADVLYHARGIIARSQRNAAALFGSARTLYSTEGSSLSIRAMLYLAVLWAGIKGIRPRIAAGRNAHKSFVGAAALLDIDVDWLYGGDADSMLSCELTPQLLADQLDSLQEPPIAVYLTSPDYLGNCVDLQGLAEVCHQRDVLLLVDNAHGAYLRFLPTSRHPISLGADLCCDSAHKTLPVLTGGGYLHFSAQLPTPLLESAETAMSLFSSTSPSYLILQSLDAANAYLADGYAERLAVFAQQGARCKERLTAQGYRLMGDEPLKLTLAPKSYGYTGRELADLLAQVGIVCEFSDPDYLVMMLSPEQGEGLLERLVEVLSGIPRRAPLTQTPPALPHPERVCSIRRATLAPSVLLPLAECAGRVLGAGAVSCPPAVMLAVSGERLDEQTLRCMEYYGETDCRVLL